MSPRPRLVALICGTLFVSSALAAPDHKAGIAYKWVDEQGVTHYGDHVPPQYSQQQRSLLNNQGVEVSHVDAALSPEQAAAAARKKAEQLRQRQHDSFLVSTYTSVADIEALRDVRLDQLQGQRQATEQYVESLRSRLGSLQARALSFAPYNSGADARRMPDDLAENLVRTLNEVRQQTAALTAKGEEEKTLRAQFDADIQRYRELHTIHTD
ncbi:MAG: DUF4124 domain-containing protein [Proteobacteria bacterium]|nr:DUF4124 domain-containing protein [Pseudomonadota bacterium]